MINLNRISNVLPCRNKSHADEEDNEGGSVVQLERKVVDRSWVCLPERGDIEVDFFGESENS